MKCCKCGYEATMLDFSRARSGGSCCSGRGHLRQCPKCKELSPCDPLMEEIWEEKFRRKQGVDAGARPDKEERLD